VLTAVRELTYRHGVAVGVDATLSSAQVARRSLYQHFGGKAGLLAEMLRGSASAKKRQQAAALDNGGQDSRLRILGPVRQAGCHQLGRGSRRLARTGRREWVLTSLVNKSLVAMEGPHNR
jgi:AcrR family transcriptional regulator